MKSMTVNIRLFGPLTDITGRSSVSIDQVKDTDEAIGKLHQLYPPLQQSPYLIAVDKEIIHHNTPLANGATMALLPPYAGG
jgi:sulfur-carrier protein